MLLCVGGCWFFFILVKSLCLNLISFFMLLVIHGRDCLVEFIVLVGTNSFMVFRIASLNSAHMLFISGELWLLYLSKNCVLNLSNASMMSSNFALL